MQRAFSLSIRVVFLLLLLLFGAMGIALAQQTINYASAGGRVTDPAGAVVPGAQVTARQTETNLSRTTTTDQEGRFRFPYLKPGPYEVTVRAAGFSDLTRSVTLAVGAAFELTVLCHAHS